MITMELEGIEALRQSWQRLLPQALDGAARALMTEADRILEESRFLTPVDTGLLVSSGMTEGPIEQGNVLEMVIRSGGHGLAPYAIRIHEDTTLNHPNGGQAHYLSGPFFAATGGMAARFSALIGPALRG
jgi:hypothetical protein